MTMFNSAATMAISRSLASDGTVRDYRRLAAHAGPWLGGKHTARITRTDVESMLAAVADRLGPKSLHNLLGFTRMVLRAEGSDAADGIRVRVPEPDVRSMTSEELALWRRALPHDEYGEALLVLVSTGLREGELVNARPEDYDVGRRALRVANRSKEGAPTKSRRHRLVEVPDDIAPVLAIRKVMGGRRLFAGICLRTLRRRMRATCKAAGLRHFTVHELRHTRITHLLLAGASVLWVSQQAGHASPAFTLQRYGHVLATLDQQRRSWANAV